MRKRVLGAVAVLICFVVFCNAPAYAAEVRASDQITYCSATLSRKSDGSLSIYFSIRATGTMDIIGVSRIAVQRYNGSDWVTEYTYTTTNTSVLQTSNTSLYQNALTYVPICVEDSYRAVVTFYVKSSAGTSTNVVTTNIV